MSDKTPFNSPRTPSDTPYWLRNGLPDLQDVARFESDHRRRLGMSSPSVGRTPTLEDERARFDAWVLAEYGVVDKNRRAMMWAAWQAGQRA